MASSSSYSKSEEDTRVFVEACESARWDAWELAPAWDLALPWELELALPVLLLPPLRANFWEGRGCSADSEAAVEDGLEPRRQSEAPRADVGGWGSFPDSWAISLLLLLLLLLLPSRPAPATYLVRQRCLCLRDEGGSGDLRETDGEWKSMMPETLQRESSLLDARPEAAGGCSEVCERPGLPGASQSGCDTARPSSPSRSTGS